MKLLVQMIVLNLEESRSVRATSGNYGIAVNYGRITLTVHSIFELKNLVHCHRNPVIDRNRTFDHEKLDLDAIAAIDNIYKYPEYLEEA